VARRLRKARAMKYDEVRGIGQVDEKTTFNGAIAVLD
jgi:hypothetical protein